MIHKLVCVLAVVSVALLGEQASGTPTEDLLSLCKNSSTTSLQIAAALKAGADVNAKKEGDWTSLMLAAEHNTNPEVISVLVRAGADVNAKMRGDWTSLMLAARDNTNPEVISALLEAGADVKAKNNAGKTALDYAKSNKNIKRTSVYWKLNDASFD